MVRWLRSSPMEYVSVTFQEDAGRRIIGDLGALGVVQVTDVGALPARASAPAQLNYEQSPFKRRYSSHMRRLDEIDRQLRYLDGELRRAGLLPARCARPSPPAEDGSLLESLEESLGLRERDERRLSLILRCQVRDYNSSVERHELAKMGLSLFSSGPPPRKGSSLPPPESESLLEEGRRDADLLSFEFLCGALRRADRDSWSRMVFRISRGHCYMFARRLTLPLLDESSGEESPSAASDLFFVFYRSRALAQKIEKVSVAFNARLHALPADLRSPAASSLESMLGEELSESREILRAAQNDHADLLQKIAEELSGWQRDAAREKSIYHVLNECSAEVSGLLRLEAWVPSESLGSIREIVLPSSGASLGLVESLREPELKEPTHFETSRVTSVFQSITDTYGVARYREINPSVFNLVTFPLLFGIMFGDLGHSFFLLLFSLYLIASTPSSPDADAEADDADSGSIAGMLRSGRYVLLLMSAFGMYFGLLYNECFGLSLDLFGSAYGIPAVTPANRLHRVGVRNASRVYPFGLDPVWKVSTNELVFVNSLKMKLSVIVGVAHMLLGLVLKLVNAHHSGDSLELRFVGLPQLVFLLSLFGYLCLLIISKWFVDWDAEMREHRSVPELISTLISLVLEPGRVPVPLYAGQGGVQLCLLVLSVLCVPVMLLVKPLSERRAPSRSYVALSGVTNPTLPLKDRPSRGLELWVSQGIETIEFVLGALSNTASYLRLWALGIAHSQLSSVLWERIMAPAILLGNPVLIVLGFYAFGLATLFFMLCLDPMECFLHAIRLHWVEFQNKFYRGDGIPFRPLRLRR